MTTEDQQINKSKPSSSSSSTNTNGPKKMQGWFKLIDAIRTTNSTSNGTTKSSLNSNRMHSYSNGATTSKQQNSSEIIIDTRNASDSSSSLNLPPTNDNQQINNIHLPNETSSIIEIESTPPAPPLISPITTVDRIEVRHSLVRSKDLPIRKTKSVVKSNISSTPILEDISDDDVPLTKIRKHQKKSIETFLRPTVNNSIIPLATDIQSLPGHCQDEERDKRFIDYTDINTLSLHLNTCLYLDKNCSSLPVQQSVTKTNSNVLIKILRLYYIKTFRNKLLLDKNSSSNMKDSQKQQPLSLISSPTSISFKSDWNVSRKYSSVNRQTPKNLFHILQLEPKNKLSIVNTPKSSTTKTPAENFQSVKDVLARTYSPHLYTAIEYGYHFGVKSKFPNTQQLISIDEQITSIKESPESPRLDDESTTITLKSPPSTRSNLILTQYSPKIITTPKLERKSNETNLDEESSAPKINSHRKNEEIQQLSTWGIKKSIVLIAPTKLPIASSTEIENKKSLNNNRKRKSSSSISTATTNLIEQKKRRVVSSSSSTITTTEIVNTIENISNSESEDELPSKLPKQIFIKNGLRSNYYKTTNDNGSKSTSAKSRQRRQSSGSLPSFYTGIFESDDNNKSYINYSLPYDIYWFNQQKSKQTSNFHHKKKKSSQPTQTQPLPYKKMTQNFYTDQIRQNLLSSYNTETAPVCNCQPPGTCEDNVCLNRMLFVECLSTCVCGVKCSNQKISKRQWFKHVEVFNTSKYGQGLRTTALIPKGTFICEYVGEIITEEKFQERMINVYAKDEHHYTMKLTQNLVIDAYRMGSVARFANHSCSPNCEFQQWTVNGLPHMCMFSLRAIKPGEELTYDYKFRCFNSQAQQPCYCESSKCRGTIGIGQQSTSTNNNNNNNNLLTIQKLTQREKRTVLQSSIFLLRNLKKIREKQKLKKPTNHKLQQKPNLSLFFAQNFYHSNASNHKPTLTCLRKTPKLTHKDLFYLFYNHIRQSHFIKTDRHHSELIDDTCYYAQLSQLTLILNEIFDLLLNYKCIDNDVNPSNALKKCPSKRVYPAYYEIITRPIDLTMIKNKLDNGEYSSFDLFEKDLLLLFQNVNTYCGEDSVQAEAVLELKNYFLNTIKINYKTIFNLFVNMNEENRDSTNLQTWEHFIERLHAKEVIYGQIRQVLYDMIYNIDENLDENLPIVYKIVLTNNTNSHRTSRSRTSSDCIVHCRCGSVYDESSLVQCYACQLWQHVACVSIGDSNRPYYCFECNPLCENEHSTCLKMNVLIQSTISPTQTDDDNYQSFSTLTRRDGMIIRINECYFVRKQDKRNMDKSVVSPDYDILFVERLWIDDYGVGQASGFFYIRPNETFHEPNRKFFYNEVFRFPSSNDPLPISSIFRPCFVLDIGTYCKGKPISDNSSRVLSSDLFICEYRVDRLARTFKHLTKSRRNGINTKSYCFDNYMEKLILKRDYQPYPKEKQQQQQQHDNRRRSSINSNRLTTKIIEEKHTRINGIIEKIYYRYHDQNLIPDDIEYTVDQLVQQSPSSVNENLQNNKTNIKRKKISQSPSKNVSPLESPAETINKKRHTISLSSDDDNDDVIELPSENDEYRKKRK